VADPRVSTDLRHVFHHSRRDVRVRLKCRGEELLGHAEKGQLVRRGFDQRPVGVYRDVLDLAIQPVHQSLDLWQQRLGFLRLEDLAEVQVIDVQHRVGGHYRGDGVFAQQSIRGGEPIERVDGLGDGHAISEQPRHRTRSPPPAAARSWRPIESVRSLNLTSLRSPRSRSWMSREEAACKLPHCTHASTRFAPGLGLAPGAESSVPRSTLSPLSPSTKDRFMSIYPSWKD